MTWPATPGSHTVQLYENESYLHRAIVTFLAEGAERGGPLVMIARRRTFVAVAERLRTDSFIFVDAEAALGTIMDGTTLNPAALERAFLALLARVEETGKGGTAWIYGELVDLLCQQGHHQAAVQLEECWNRLTAGRGQIVTMCTYAIESFDDEDGAGPLRAICHEHTHIMPTENVIDAPDDRGRAERIVLLEHRARVLERAVSPRLATATAPTASVPPSIYVVDDDASVRKSLERLLLSVDLTVRSFSSAEELLSAMDGSSGGCLIVDVQLLGMSGTELQQRLAHAQDRWPIIAMSGAYDAQIEHEALRRGAVAFLRKPFVAEALFDAIARARALTSKKAPCRR